MKRHEKREDQRRAFDFCGARITPVRLEIAFPKAGVQNSAAGTRILAYLNAHPGQVITRKR